MKVESMRAGLLARRRERVWLLLTKPDGTVDIQEDYAPWGYVLELRDGHITSRDGDDVDYEVRWLAGDEKRSAFPLPDRRRSRPLHGPCKPVGAVTGP